MEPSRRERLNPDDYTVVWFAPLAVEAQACFGVLDEVHKGFFEIQAGQDYVFSGGRIKEHNIILATFPMGQNYGTVSAAALINQVKLLFPTKLVLLVGIAAGVPKLDAPSRREQRDIRLGDVIIAVPDKTLTGIVPYDSGTNTIAGFSISSRQAETLSIVRSIYSYIERHYPNPFSEEDGEFAGYLRDALKKLRKRYPREDFERPDQNTDELYSYKDDYDEEGVVVDRVARDEPNVPQTWYGSIGSGNTLMRNHKERDRLRDLHGLIGLEMEAAGVMNFAQAAVIRGVCDYGDKKKNKDWQAYAAVVAAVYAKGVLMEINPASLKKVEDTGDGMVRNKRSEPYRPPNSIRIYQLHGHDTTPDYIPTQSEEGDRILRWLSNHQFTSRQRTLLERYTDGTIGWFFDSEEYKQWMSGNARTLLCTGIHGAGKSMAMALTAEKLQENVDLDHACGAIFFKREQDRTISTLELLKALARQVIESKESIPNTLLQIYRSCTGGSGQRIEEKDVITMLGHEIRSRNKVLFIIDALDECDGQTNLDLLRHLSTLQKRYTNLMVMISIPKIDSIVDDASRLLLSATRIHFRAANEDLQTYIDDKFNSRSSLRHARNFPDTLSEFKKLMVKRADGMFLFVVLCCQLLEARSPETEREFSNAINELRQLQELRDIYIAMWLSIMSIEKMKKGSADRNADYKVGLARNVFMWVSYSIKPLTIQELRYALAAQNTLAFDIEDKDLLPRNTITEPCLGLIIINENDVVDFMHDTARETFRAYLRNTLKKADDQMGKACLRFLGQKKFEGSFMDQESGRQMVARQPFLLYSAKAWAHHAKGASSNFKFNFLLDWLSVETNTARLARMMALLDLRYRHDMREVPHYVPPQSLLAFSGLLDVLWHVLEWGTFPSPFRWTGYIQSYWPVIVLGSIDLLATTIFQSLKYRLAGVAVWTALEGILGVLIMFYVAERDIREKADANEQDSNGWSPLRWATWGNHPDAVQMLIATGASVDIVDDSGASTLTWALDERSRQDLTQKLMISEDGDITLSIGTLYELPECTAYPDWITPSSTRCSEQLVEILIQHTQNMNLTNQNGRTPLMQAAHNRQFQYMQLMLDHGADVELVDNEGMTALLLAVQSSDEDIQTPDMDIRGGMALHVGDHIILKSEGSGISITESQQIITEILGQLCSDRIIEVTDRRGRTALAHAVESGQNSLATHLVNLGADLDSADDIGLTPLLRACVFPNVRGLRTGTINVHDEVRVTQGHFFEVRDPGAGHLLESVRFRAHMERVGLIRMMLERKGFATMSSSRRQITAPDAPLLEQESKSIVLADSNESPSPASTALVPNHPPNFSTKHRTTDPIAPGEIMALEDLTQRQDRRETLSMETLSHNFNPFQAVYKSTNVDGDSGAWQGDWSLTSSGSGAMTSSKFSTLGKIPIARLYAGHIAVHDHARLIQGHVYGDANYTLSNMWSHPELKKFRKKTYGSKVGPGPDLKLDQTSRRQLMSSETVD